MKEVRIGLVLAAIVAATACVPRRDPPPPPPQQQTPLPPPPQPAPPPPPPAHWRDLPLTPGGWYYSGSGQSSQALFGVPNSEGIFIVRCDRARRQVILSREGEAASTAMTVRTTETARTLPATQVREPLAYLSASLPANDRLLDHIAFSRGRFSIEAPGMAMLVLPSWPEPARVVEDCRS